jgi:hypothetical protein
MKSHLSTARMFRGWGEGKWGEAWEIAILSDCMIWRWTHEIVAVRVQAGSESVNEFLLQLV